jgi:hypothetical protein
MERFLVEGPESISHLKSTNKDAFLPAYNQLYPYLNIYTIPKNTALSFPHMVYECVLESDAGNRRFENQCLSALFEMHPEWDAYYSAHPEKIKTLLRGSVSVSVNKESVVCVIVDVSSAPDIVTSAVKWACIDELIYSPKLWKPAPVIKEMFTQHSFLRHILIQTQKKEWQVAPFPLIVYSSEPNILPQLDETWGWIYKYTSTPSPNSRRHMAFVSNVYYNINPETPEPQQKQLWEKAGFMYMTQKRSGIALFPGRPQAVWISRDPFPMLD